MELIESILLYSVLILKISLLPSIISNAASIIVAHNHPSNDPTPSSEDLEVTKRLIEAGKVVGIEVLDHLIVCEESFISLKEKGHM